MNKGGYTLVSLMLANIALASFTVPGLGKRLHAIGRKRVVLTDINIAGERMKDIGVQVDLDTEIETDDETGEEITHYKALIRDVYGYFLSVTDDTISSEQSKDPLELQKEIEDLQDKTQKITRSESATEVDGTLSADVIYGATSINSPSGAFDELEGGAITGDSIIENMTGYSFDAVSTPAWTPVYAGACKNGNKVTFVVFGTFTKQADQGYIYGNFTIPSDVGSKLYPTTVGSLETVLDNREILVGDLSAIDTFYKVNGLILKTNNTTIQFQLRGITSVGNIPDNTQAYFRYESTFLLSDNLIPQP